MREPHATISFRIISHANTADDITTLLGIEPTGYKTIHAENRLKTIWYLEEGANDEVSLDKRIRSLVTKVITTRETWPDEINQWNKEVFCGLFLDRWNEGFLLSAATLHLLAVNTIDLSFDIYDSPTKVDRTEEF